MSRSNARWLTAPAVAPLPPFLPPPGVTRPAPPADEPPQSGWALTAVRGFSAAVLAVLAGMLVWSALPLIAGWAPHVVLTGSMQPRIAPGDVVLAAPVDRAQLQPGRIILFRDPVHPGRTVVHRLVRINDSGTLTTKGDANNSEDSTPVAVADVLGMPRLRIPMVGKPLVWRHERALAPLAMSAGAAFLLLAPFFSRRP